MIAKSLAQEPDVIIFDEPTRGVDVGAIVEIHELINRLADEAKAVVVTSSYLLEIMALSDRILVSRRGKVVEESSALRTEIEKLGKAMRTAEQDNEHPTGLEEKPSIRRAYIEHDRRSCAQPFRSQRSSQSVSDLIVEFRQHKRALLIAQGLDGRRGIAHSDSPL